MKKKQIVFASSILLLITACSQTWDKAAAKKYCVDDLQGVIKMGKMTNDTADKLCDCESEKMIIKFKSKSEAIKKDYDRMVIRANCGKEIKGEAPIYK